MAPSPWIPPNDEWAKESALVHWFANWRDPATALGFDFLYTDGKPREKYPQKDNWEDEEYPVNYASAWAKGRKKWEVWLDAYDSWDHEFKRLCEVYTRIAEPLDAEEAEALWEGKFPKPPLMPALTDDIFKASRSGDVVTLAGLLENEEADPEAKDHTLQTPLMAAALSGSLECVEYLADLGVDLTCEDCEKDTAFDLAIAAMGSRQPDHPVILFFKNAGAPRGHGVRGKMMAYLS